MPACEKHKDCVGISSRFFDVFAFGVFLKAFPPMIRFYFA